MICSRIESSYAAFIDYLNAVDELLETQRGYSSDQEELEDVAAAQEALLTPAEAVGEWALD